MDTETVGGTAPGELAQEDDLTPRLLDFDMVVADPRIDFLQVIELMIVSCEKCLGPFAIFVYI